MGFNPVSFLWTQCRNPLPPVAPTDLAGRVVVVTGSNVGLGLETSVFFAEMGPKRLILAVRNASKGEAAAKDIEERTGGKVKPEVWIVDMASFDSVKAFAAKMDKELDRLDILVLNAGLDPGKRVLTEDGLETTIQVNAIATTLLAVLSLPILKRTAAIPALPTLPTFKPHLTIVTSFVHFMVAKLPGQGEGKVLEEVLSEKTYGAYGQTYNYSKTVLIHNIRDITRLAGPSVIVDHVDPGFVLTNFMDGSSGIGRWLFFTIAPRIARTVPEGAKTLVWAALADVPSGSYTESCKVAVPSDLVAGPGFEARGDEIWEELKVLLKEKAKVEFKSDGTLAAL